MKHFLLYLSFVIVTTSYSYSYAQSVTSCKEHECIAVVDAGSTGTRVHIYAYDTDTTNSPININELWSKKIKPGFASIEPTSNTIDTYLSTLLSGAPEQHIPVYFYATAGMRLASPSKQKNYYEQLKYWFSQHPEWQLMDAKTLTGTEEALYDWLSVNYHLGNFTSPEGKSVGVMDMGGASVQIVFPIAANKAMNNKSQVELDMYGQHFNLSVHSFLGLGQTELSHQFLNSASCFANNYPLPDGDTGQGNASACAHKVSSLINNVHEVNNLIQALLIANPVDSWYAIGGISNLADNPLFHFENAQLTSKNLLEQGENKICHQQWDALDKQFPEDDYMHQYCLLSAYYYALIVDGYGIYPEQTINYIPPSKNLDWTSGVVLYHSTPQNTSTIPQ